MSGSSEPARGAPDHAGDRCAEREPHQQRGERERAAEQRVVEHGHLDQHPAHALGRRDRRLECGVGAQRGAADHGLLDLDVIEQRDRLPPEPRHGVVRHLGRAVRIAVAEQVEA
jgi:hypothetical protein